MLIEDDSCRVSVMRSSTGLAASITEDDERKEKPNRNT
jgi:hypothetical protein